jgi:hypothetical protein
MPERSAAQSMHAALVFLGWAGLMTAGFCFPATAILAQFYMSSGMAALYWLGPVGLFVGCLSAVVAIFFAHAALGVPLPSGSPRTERWIVPLWIAIMILIALRCTVLSGIPAVLAEALYSTYPFLIALGLAPALVNVCPAIPQAATQQTLHSARHRRSASGRS